MRLLLAFVGASLIVAGFVYLLFPHSAVGFTRMLLPGAAAAIDARSSHWPQWPDSSFDETDLWPQRNRLN